MERFLNFDSDICHRESSRSKQGGEWTNPDGMDSALADGRIDVVELELMPDIMLLAKLRSAAPNSYKTSQLVFLTFRVSHSISLSFTLRNITTWINNRRKTGVQQSEKRIQHD